MLAACGGSVAGAQGNSPTATADVAGDTAADAGNAADSCTDFPGQEALKRWIGDVPTVNGWAWSTKWASVENYDPCLPLSWIRVTIEKGTSSSPYQMMLFHRGEYLGPATEESSGFGPDTVRIDDESIEVTWYWAKPGESNALHAGEAAAQFRWDDATGEVVMTGDLPGGAAGKADNGQRGAIPADAAQIRSVKPYSGGVAVFKTPSGNIDCGIYADSVRCGISSHNTDEPYGTKPTGGAVDTVHIRDGAASLGASSDPGQWMSKAFGGDDTTVPQVVGYGETVYYGAFACTSEQDGLTCWDSETGAGAFMSRERTDLFQFLANLTKALAST